MKIEINTVDVRRLGITLLDDGEGISEPAYDLLYSLLKEANCEDILNMVDATNGRFYIGEVDAEEALRDLSKWEEAQEAQEAQGEVSS